MLLLLRLGQLLLWWLIGDSSLLNLHLFEELHELLVIRSVELQIDLRADRVWWQQLFLTLRRFERLADVRGRFLRRWRKLRLLHRHSKCIASLAIALSIRKTSSDRFRRRREVTAHRRPTLIIASDLLYVV